MKRLRAVIVGLALSMFAGMSSGGQGPGVRIAAVDSACSTPAARSGVGSGATSADQRVSLSQATQDSGQGRLGEYLSLHAEVRHQSGLAEGMPWRGPRAQAN